MNPDNQQTVEEARKRAFDEWNEKNHPKFKQIVSDSHFNAGWDACIAWQQSQSTNTGEGEGSIADNEYDGPGDPRRVKEIVERMKIPPQQSGGDGKKDELIKIMNETINKSEIEVERLNSEVMKLIGVLEELIFDYEHGSWSWSKTLKAKEAIKPYKQ